MGRPLKEPAELPPIERLRQLVRYDGGTGRIYWQYRTAETFNGAERYRARSADRWNAMFAGKEAGGDYHGYRRVTIDGTHHFEHRVIWKLVTGETPAEIDHIDGDISNNRLSNLRSVIRPVNMRNKALYANNSSGVPGVMFHKRDKVWMARIGVGGKQVQLGSFKTKDEAIAAVMAGRIVLEYHPNHGRQP